MSRVKILVCFGTRPEAIKMAPLVEKLSQCDWLDLKVCVTAQHRQMLDQVLRLFEIEPDFDLNVMSTAQSLTDLSCSILKGMEQVFNQFRPDIVLVHGDTATTLMVSLAAYYHKVPVAHVEAGLRTGNKYSPWPEELNRKLTADIAEVHFAPTVKAKENLVAEGINSDAVYVTGNTVVDALLKTYNRIRENNKLENEALSLLPALNSAKKIILVTGHRRESFGSGFENICQALAELSRRDDVQIIYPVHLNPNVREPVNRILFGRSNVFLVEPLDYLPFVMLMSKSYIILTDSGGIQEEAPSLRKPVFVMRDTTERLEVVQAGVARLIGCERGRIVSEITRVLDDEKAYEEMLPFTNPYGDGLASERIVEVLKKQYGR